MTKEKLNHCPFCGGNPIIKFYDTDQEPFHYFTPRYDVQCEWTGEKKGCGSEGSHQKIKSIAIEYWNKRVRNRSNNDGNDKGDVCK